MKPIKLEFEGINSFSEHTIIDFEKLTKSGIFGIFGDTGSGKSTILDCINFALYGRVERSKEKTDIINYRCNSASVKFTFTITNCGKRKTYLAERLIKNDKSGTHRALLYEDGACIADKATEVEKKVVEILGLEAEDFRKCIALPQGEFAQFVKSAPRERLALIERLFSLSKYGDRLKEKISARQSEADGEYRNLCGKYSGYENVNEENLNVVLKQLEEEKVLLQETGDRARDFAEKLNGLKILYQRRTELEETVKKLSELTELKSEMDELGRDLTALPACREVVSVQKELREAENKLYETEEKIGEKARESSATSNLLKELEIKLERGNFAEKSDEYTKLSAKYQTCAGKPEKLEELRRGLRQKREEYSSAEKEREKLLAEFQSVKARAEGYKTSLGDSKSDELEKLVNVEFKGAILRGEYVAMLDYFVNLSALTEKYYENSELYKFIQKELANQIENFKSRIYAVKDFKLENVNKQFVLLQQAMKEREEISEKLLSATREASDLEGRLNIGKNKLDTLKREGIELRKRFDELKAELDGVFGENCADYAAAEAENSKRLESVKAEWQDLNLQIEKTKRSGEQINLEAEKLKTLSQSLRERISSLKVKLNAAIEKSGLATADKCAELAEKFDSYPDAEKAFKEFNVKLVALTARKEELYAIDGIESVSYDDLLNAQKQKNEADNILAELNGAVAVTEANLKGLKEKLKEKLELSKELEASKKRLELIERLKEITKNNRFLEFIADEYLCDISSMASETLLNLTDGRYFLIYKDNNFNVGDNFDCGNLRGVNTLSGGETFLVSLSLALALSQTICSKSLKSIEFFFLDEGFGTLDSSLLDTVMNALEKLKSSQFIIGVISHVEELKHRIDSKITIIKATENHGSTVQMSC